MQERGWAAGMEQEMLVGPRDSKASIPGPAQPLHPSAVPAGQGGLQPQDKATARAQGRTLWSLLPPQGPCP